MKRTKPYAIEIPAKIMVICELPINATKPDISNKVASLIGSFCGLDPGDCTEFTAKDGSVIQVAIQQDACWLPVEMREEPDSFRADLN